MVRRESLLPVVVVMLLLLLVVADSDEAVVVGVLEDHAFFHMAGISQVSFNNDSNYLFSLNIFLEY